MLTHLAVAVLAAAAAVGVTLEVDHPAGSSGASLPGAAEVPSPPAAPPGGTAAGGSEQQVVNKVEPAWPSSPPTSSTTARPARAPA